VACLIRIDPPNGKFPSHASETAVFFLACNVTHISTEVNAAPKAAFADGHADLLMMRGCSRTELMKFLLDFGAVGDHASHPNLQYVKAKAFVLRPVPHKGNVLLGVDGEIMDPTLDLQVEVHQGLCTIFSSPKHARPN
jgi:diacylglycerol kinase family enzyme